MPTLHTLDTLAALVLVALAAIYLLGRLIHIIRSPGCCACGARQSCPPSLSRRCRGA